MDREQILLDALSPKPLGRPVTGRRTTYEWRRPDREIPEITHSFGYYVITEEREDRFTSREARVLIHEAILPADFLMEGGAVAFLGYEWRLGVVRALSEWAPTFVGAPEFAGEPTHEVVLHGTAP